MYFVRLLNGPPHKVRDGRKMSDEVKIVRSDAFTKFEHLPAGLEVGTDKGFEVREVTDKGEAHKIENELRKRAAVEAERAEAHRVKVRAKIALQEEPAREANRRAREHAEKMNKERAAERAKEVKASEAEERKSASRKTEPAGNRTK